MAECVERASAAALAAEAKATRAKLTAEPEDAENRDPQLRFVTERRRRNKPLVDVTLPLAPMESTPEEREEDEAVPAEQAGTAATDNKGATPAEQPRPTLIQERIATPDHMRTTPKSADAAAGNGAAVGRRTLRRMTRSPQIQVQVPTCVETGPGARTGIPGGPYALRCPSRRSALGCA